MTRTDMILVRSALEQRWPISSQYRDVLIKQLMKVVADPNAKRREVIAAARVLVAAEAQNQQDETHADFSQRVIEIANRLGINIGDGGIGQTTSQRAITGRQ